MRICTLGDLLLDVIVRPDGTPGAGNDVTASTRLGAGGQAANVAAWVAHLGGVARCVAKLADDPAGRLVRSELEGRGVELRGPTVPAGTGTVVSMVDTGGERAMMSDRGVSPDLRAAELDEAWFADIDRLHVTGYALLRDPIGEAAIAAARMARRAGARISLDLSAAGLILAAGPGRFLRRLADLAPEVVLGTEAEMAAIGGEPAVPVVVVKRGAAGCSIRWPGGARRVPAPHVAVVDTTGAGDAFAAGFLLGETMEQAAAGATAAAGQCLVRMGAMPDMTTPAE